MKTVLQSSKKVLVLPDTIYLDQLMKIDLSMIQDLKNLKGKGEKLELSKIQPLLKWIVQFFKAIDVKHRFTLPECMELMQGKDFIPWMTNLFGSVGNLA